MNNWKKLLIKIDIDYHYCCIHQQDLVKNKKIKMMQFMTMPKCFYEGFTKMIKQYF